MAQFMLAKRFQIGQWISNLADDILVWPILFQTQS